MPRSVPQPCRPVVAGGGGQPPVRAESSTPVGPKRWPRATPPRIPSRRRRNTRRGGIPHLQRGHHDPGPPRQAGRGHRPTTRLGHSDSQAVNTPECSALLQGVLSNRVLERLQLSFSHVGGHFHVDTPENTLFHRWIEVKCAALPAPVRFCVAFVILVVTPLAGHGGEDDRREPRRGRSECHRDPRSTFQSTPRAPLLAPGGYGRLPQPADRAPREHPAPGSRSSPRALKGSPAARRPQATPNQGRTPPRDLRKGRTPGKWRGLVRHGRNGGSGPGRLGAARSGCSEPPRHYPGKPRGLWAE